MKLYDYCIFECTAEIRSMAANLGWDGIGLLKNNYNTDLPATRNIDTVKGLVIESENSEEIRKAAGKRKKIELIVVKGLTEEANRAAVESVQIDILIPGENTRIDYVMVKLSAKNNVSIAFDFSQLLKSSGADRSRIFSRLSDNAKLVKKYKSPFIITSGAVSEWDLRAPSELIAFGKNLGFDESVIRKMMSDNMISENRKRLGIKWIMPGVEVE